MTPNMAFTCPSPFRPLLTSIHSTSTFTRRPPLRPTLSPRPIRTRIRPNFASAAPTTKGNTSTSSQSTLSTPHPSPPPPLTKLQTLRHVLKLAAPDTPFLLLAVSLAVLSSFTLLITPFIFGRTLDAVASFQTNPNASLRPLFRSTRILIFAYVITATLQIAEVVSIRIAAERFVSTLRTRVFSSLIRSDIAVLEATPVPDWLTRLSTDTVVLQRVISDDLTRLVQGLFETFISTTMLFVIAAPLAPVIATCIPISVGAATLYGLRTAKQARTLSTALADANSTAGEQLSGVRSVKAFAREQFAEERYAVKLRDVLRCAVRAGWADGVLRGWNRLVFGVNTAMVFLFGGMLVARGILTVGATVTFLMYATNLTGALTKLSMGIGEVVRASGAIERILQIVRTTPTIERWGKIEDEVTERRLENGHVAVPGTETDEEGRRGGGGSVEFHDVSFRYPSAERLVLKNVSMRIAAGGSVALVGKSGGGKSTIASLLVRFYDPESGRVEVNGQDLRDQDVRKVREHIVGIVPQEPFLVRGTLAENIAFGAEGATRADIEKAAKAAGVDQLARRLPDGLDTMISRLSGGETQRVMIARCLVKEPMCVVLDEPTAALDAKAEALVNETIEGLMRDGKRTVILISHRLGAVRGCDRIYVFGEGEIVDEGTHCELVSRGGDYSKWLRQRDGNEADAPGVA